jgi:RNA polymerase sigma factor (sigma-70 family)
VDAASDATLVARCLASEQGAWDALVERYARYVYAIAARVYRLEPSDAEDVFQEVFARVFERLDTLRDADALRPWIAQTTRRCAVDALRRSGRETSVDELPDGADEALARLPRDPRPVLHARRELSDDRGPARPAAWDDREPHRAVPRAAPRRPPAGRRAVRGRKPTARASGEWVRRRR